MQSTDQPGNTAFGMIDASGLARLIDVLSARGFCVIAPVLQDGVIVLSEIKCVDDTPVGLVDEQAPGTYRADETDSKARFAYSVGPQSLKKYLHPPEQMLWRGTKDATGQNRFEQHLSSSPSYAFFGVRACDLQAVRVLDKVFLDGEPTHAQYSAHREKCLFIAVDCAAPSSTCFCTSFEQGPDAKHGYDLAITEFTEKDQASYLIRSATTAGADFLEALDADPATKKDLEMARRQHEKAREKITHRMNTEGLPELLKANPDHSQWDDVAARCLTCGNCTMVCPTCFCTTQQTRTSLLDAAEERWETWDSCFTLDFTQIGDGSVRYSPKSRYRQWLTHKLGTWMDQFDELGCVGCGRCITWCPVGIDIRKEVAEMQGDRQTSEGDAS